MHNERLLVKTIMLSCDSAVDKTLEGLWGKRRLQNDLQSCGGSDGNYFGWLPHHRFPRFGRNGYHDHIETDGGVVHHESTDQHVERRGLFH